MEAIRNSKGFTLMELIVVLGVLALLAAILVPILFDYVEDARKAKAKSDVNAIRAAIFKLNTDTRKWPTDVSPTTDCLHSGEGTAPTITGCDEWGELEDHLIENNAGYPSSGKMQWNGSYIDANIKTDPWGKAYVVYLKATGKHAWVLSAGTDQGYNTGPDNAKLLGDDIGAKIR